MEVEGAMKVQNTTIFMGDNTRNERHGKEVSGKNGQKTVYAGNLNKNFDPVAQKKQQARKQAMKVITDARENDLKIEQSFEESRSRLKEHREKLGNANTELKRIEDERMALKESYGIDENSREEQELQLLVKREEANRPGSGVRLTKEEREQLEEIEKNGLTEYQKHSLELYKSGEVYRNEKVEAEEGIEAENDFIRSMKRELPKNQGMLKAQAAADEIMEAASKEIVGMLMDEAKDHIDEEMEEKKEAAQEKAEEEKEEEEKIEKIKEDKAEKEEFAESVSEQTEDITKYMVEMEDTMGEVQQEVKKIIDEMKLLEEDMKGIAVDTIG